MCWFSFKESVNPAQDLKCPENYNGQITSKVILSIGNASNCIDRSCFPVVSGSCFCWQAAWRVVNDLRILVMAAIGAALLHRLECQCSWKTLKAIKLPWI